MVLVTFQPRCTLTCTPCHADELFDRGARGVMVWRSEGDTAFDPPDEAMDGEGEAGARLRQ
jgi:hypothetical protein